MTDAADQGWTEQMVAELRRMWEIEGFSASQTAAALSRQFDRAVSRNAVIGKVYRLRLRQPLALNVVRKPVNLGPRNGRQPAPISLPAESALSTVGKPDPAPRPSRAPPSAIPKPTPAVPETSPVPLADILKVTGCRFSVAQDISGQHLFCNRPKHGDSSWCAAHWNQVYSDTGKRYSGKGLTLSKYRGGVGRAVAGTV